MIKFIELHIKNFLSIGEVSLNLTHEDFTLIDAKNLRTEDKSESNGSGKSALFESLVWCLTGTSIRGYKDVVNRYQEDSCIVSVKFLFNETEWKVVRSRSKKGAITLQIYKNGIELQYKGLRDAELLLEQTLPEITSTFLGSVVILGQGLPQRFTNNSPSGRKAVLEELTRANYMIDHLSKNVLSRKAVLEQNSIEVNNKLVSANTDLLTFSRLLEEAETKLKVLEDYDLETFNLELSELEKDGKQARAEYDLATQELQLLDKTISFELEEYFRGKSFYENLISESKFKIAKKSESLSEKFFNQEKQELEKYDRVLSKLSDQIKDLETQERDIRSFISGGFCRVCKQKLPSISEEDIANKKIVLEKILLELSEKRVEYQNIIKIKSEVGSNFKRELDTELKKLKEEYSLSTIETKAALDSLKTVYEQKQAKSTLIKSEVLKAQNLANNLLVQLREQFVAKKSLISKIESELENLSENKKNYLEKIDKCKKESEDLLKIQENLKERLDIMCKMSSFLSRDFRGVLLKDILEQLNSILKKYAREVYGEPLTNICQNGNNIDISFDGKEYESLSGGERQKLDILLQLSLRDLMIQISGVKANLVVFDELFDSLDFISSEQVLKVLLDLGLQTYIITHRKDLNIPYDRRFILIKEPSGIARLEVE